MKANAVIRAAELEAPETRGPVGAGRADTRGPLAVEGAEFRARAHEATIAAKCELMRRQVDAAAAARVRGRLAA